MPSSLRLLFLTTFLGASSACAGPLQALQVGPAAHDKGTTRIGPQPIAWRANALAAPCALLCRPSAQRRGLACTCHALDSIYYSALQRAEHARTAREGTP